MTETAVAVASPDASASGEDSTADVFEARVSRLVEMIGEDPAVRDRMLAEVYVTISEFSESFRMFQTQMTALGPKAFLSMLTGRGNGLGAESE